MHSSARSSSISASELSFYRQAPLTVAMAHTRPAPQWRVGPASDSFSRPGLEAMVKKAVEEAGLRETLPWNFVTWGPVMNTPRDGRHLGPQWLPEGFETVPELVERYARFCGWLKAVAANPVGRRFLERTQSDRGMNSPDTTANLWDVQARFPSPGEFCRWVSRTVRRSNEILNGRCRVSWAAIAWAAQHGPRAPRKATRVAVAFQLTGRLIWGGLREANRILPYVLTRGTPSRLPVFEEPVWEYGQWPFSEILMAAGIRPTSYI